MALGLDSGNGSSSQLWVPATTFVVGGGSPTLGTVGAAGAPFEAWLLDSGLSEHVAASFLPPKGWATYDVDLWWTNAGANAGDVHYILYGQPPVGDGDTLAGNTNLGSSTLVAPAEDVVKVSTVVTGRTATDDHLGYLAVLRQGGNAADTLANDAGLLGVMLRKAS